MAEIFNSYLSLPDLSLTKLMAALVIARRLTNQARSILNHHNGAFLAHNNNLLGSHRGYQHFG